LERYFLEPYRFIPPFRSTFWCRIGRRVVLRHLRRKFGVVRWRFSGLEHLRESLSRQAGILLTPNHSRWSDPMLMGALGCEVRQFLYYVASYHLFRQSKIMGWVLNRLGGYSIWREGIDRQSIKATTSLLAEADRPVVLFPEGTWFRQNDKVGPLQEGLSLITRQTIRQTDRPIVIHPVAIKYWMLEDPSREMRRRLDHLERRLGWSAQSDCTLLARIEKLGGAMIALKEIEYLGSPQSGDLDQRIARITSSQVEQLENKHLGKAHDGWTLERIRRLRQLLTRELLEKATQHEQSRQTKKDLDDLLFLENLNAHSLEYVRENPSLERLAETIQRIEETVSDQIEAPIAPMGADVQVGPAIDVRTFQASPPAGRKEGDPLVQHLRQTIQTLLDQLLAQGPPSDWGCPAQSQPASQQPPKHPTQARRKDDLDVSTLSPAKTE
jgi:hypothetical protein